MLNSNNKRVQTSDFTNPSDYSTFNSQTGIDWYIKESQHKDSKSIYEYSIMCNSGYCLVEGLYSKESANFIMGLVKNGVPMSDKKILGALSMSLQYGIEVNSIIESLKKRQDVLRESNYDEARKMDTYINNKKTEVHKLRNNLLEYIRKFS